MKTIVYPGAKTLTHGYDPAGRLITHTDWAARVSTFGYDKAGRLTTHAYPNGVLDTISYHNDGTVKKLDFTRAGGGAFTAFALEYAYDRNGNKTQEKKKGVLDWQPGPAAGQVAPFDEIYTFKAPADGSTPAGSGRLATSADALNPNRNLRYTYNAAGDMTLADSPGQTTAFTYDEDHRVLTVARTEAGVTTTIANRYDALGRRIARTLTPPGAAAVETRYVLGLTGSMERILADTDATATGNVLARYVHGPGGLGYREDAATGAITCFHADAMGNILRLTDATGSAVADYAYSPYGRLLGSSGTATNPYRFVGSQGVMEELPNLYFMRARYYSGETGIFLSTDPVKKIGPGWKAVAYGYGNGNPLLFSDPKGEFGLADALLGVIAETVTIHYEILVLGKTDITVRDVLARSAGAFAGGLVGGKGLAGSFGGELVSNTITDALDGGDFSINDILVNSAAGAALDEFLPMLVKKVPGRKPLTDAAKILGAHGAQEFGIRVAGSALKSTAQFIGESLGRSGGGNQAPQSRPGAQLQPAPKPGPAATAAGSGNEGSAGDSSSGGLSAHTAAGLASTLNSISSNINRYTPQQRNQISGILTQLSRALSQLSAARNR